MKFHFQIKNRSSELATLHATLVCLGNKWSLSSKTVVELNLILDELASNIVEHGDSDKEREIDIKLTKRDTVIVRATIRKWLIMDGNVRTKASVKPRI